MVNTMLLSLLLVAPSVVVGSIKLPDVEDRRMPSGVSQQGKHTNWSQELVESNSTEWNPRPSIVNCTWRYYEQPLSHFMEGSTIAGNATFKERVCLYTKFWKAPSKSLSGVDSETDLTGPILLYTGNEAPVEEYINNTGLIWDLGKKMGALIVFAEHRYEGDSWPQMEGVPNCFSYCTTKEAIADYAHLVRMIKKEFKATSSPVVAFGGSYGGMLAAWMRIRYPNVIDGAIAASAPIWGTPLTYPEPDGYAVAITKGISESGGAAPMCEQNMAAAIPLIHVLGQTEVGRKIMSDAFDTCKPLETVGDVQRMLGYAQGPWFNMAEGNYPFASTYITYNVGPGLFPLPPWPMRLACEGGLQNDFKIEFTGDRSDVKYNIKLGSLTVAVDWDNATLMSGTFGPEEQKTLHGLVEGVSNAVKVWYNVTKTLKCNDVGTESANAPQSLAEKARAAWTPTSDGEATSPSVCGNMSHSLTAAWEGVCCNENLDQVNYLAHGIGRDFFWPPNVPRNFSVEKILEARGTRGCRAGPDDPRGYPAMGDPFSTDLDDYYGGLKIGAASNIVFSNGELDPWSSGGVTRNVSGAPTLIPLLLDLGAHHLDLFFPTPNDPPCAINARIVEEANIRQWVKQSYARTIGGN